MSKSASEKPDDKAEVAPTVSEPSAPVTFRDTAYLSRTLVLASGRTVPVVNHQVTVTVGDDELLAYLQQHHDFTPHR